MNRLQQPVSAWIESLDRQLVRAKHVLLHGNTSDLALYSGTASRKSMNSPCMTLDSALHQYLIDAGFELVLHFTAADGLQLAAESMLDAFNRTCAAIDGSDGQQAEHMLNIATEDLFVPVNTIHRLLCQGQVSCAVVMHCVDKLVSNPESQAANELRALVRLKQAIQKACFASDQTGLRNTFIGVAGQLSAAPGWLYVDNPRLMVVPVSRPNARERRHLIAARLQEFHGATDLSPERQEQVVQELGDRTDGMSLFDISLLPRVSLAEEIELASAQELVRAARFGKKEDPWRELDGARLAHAEQLLRARVKGQDAAVAHVVSTLHHAHGGIGLGSNRAHGGPPKGVFLFVGPTGVGKTELAKALAELVFGDDDRMKVFDMSEYQIASSGERLAGAPPGYLGYEKGGQLTNHVLSEPFSVILFDEFEKADASVNDKFLGILEEGRLTDGRGMTAYFDQTMLVFTSNIGSDQLTEQLQASPGKLPTYEELRSLYTKAVQHHFAKTVGRPELLGRYGDNIVVFDMLRPELVVELCSKFLGELRDNARRVRQIELEMDGRSISDYLTRQMQQPENMALGGRRVRELIVTTVVRPLNDHLFLHKPPPGSQLYLSVSPPDGRISIRGPL